MTDYFWYPVTGDGQSLATQYVWNGSAQNWNVTANWMTGNALDLVTYPLTPGYVPGSGAGTSGGPGQDNAFLYSAEINPLYLSFYTPNPANGEPYIGSNSLPANVVINSGTVDINNLTLAAFNTYADAPEYSTLSVQGATLQVQGNVYGTGTLIFPTIPISALTIGGTLTAVGGGTIDLSTGATVQIAGTVDSGSNAIKFDFLDGNANLLSLGGETSATPSAFGGVIQNFAVGDTIDLTSVKDTGGSAPVLNSANDVLIRHRGRDDL